ncbi:glycosyltransferase involved in cell wall biosynthesis [Natronocella acetinitrilica]|uniref:Glycosyltransferase involved in cell wall biosynthesis n=1 Tax=Natronocella acetinitrilica TaxID=414046 RepID=A0AAE3G336_9GAMM|nr:glycosyltransferase [Natronocella acetinitrilica]MCP1673528.1 glycosyltransferase involved in cell wall biosynthesis [Natronocella acetinitrilica]
MPDTSATPALSVIIPAWNESALLPGTLAALHEAVAASGVAAEIIVVDNDSDDDTARVAKDAGARVVHEPRRGIACARNAGAARAGARILLFLDADTQVDATHLGAVMRAVDGGWGGGGAPLELTDMRYPVYRPGVTVWNWLARRLNLAAGCFLFVRRDLHEAMGGFDERIYAGEEINYSRRLARLARREGLRFGILSTPPVRSSGRKTHWFAPWQHVLVLLTFVLFPVAGRFRRLSWFWYRRPE